jgi:pimeloyl-ACP methyl ester carboxylesterase
MALARGEQSDLKRLREQLRDPLLTLLTLLLVFWIIVLAPLHAAAVINTDIIGFLIGHGSTEAPASGYAIERQVALIKAVLDRLGVDRVTVIGNSMGGEVATAFAESDSSRIERLVLIDPRQVSKRRSIC